MFLPFDILLRPLLEVVALLVGVGVLSSCGGVALAVGLRLRSLRWTWGAVPIVPALLMAVVSIWPALVGLGVCVVACLVGMVWQSQDLIVGGDRGEAARSRTGVFRAAEIAYERWQTTRGARGWVHDGRLEVGVDIHGGQITIPAGGESGSHTLILGATGSGKTSGQAWIAGRLIEHGHGAVVIDPKGDEQLRDGLREVAEAAGAPFLGWSPSGPLGYNPYAHGTDTEIADKALSGEVFTEPHYLRQAQRYLGHAVRTMRGAGVEVTAASLMAHMNPDQLEQTAKRLPAEHKQVLHEYLDSLSERSRSDLSGVRDRLSILAESDVAPWLDPGAAGGTIDLAEGLRRRSVVYFELDADRRPLLAQMLAGAIVGDLITLAASPAEQRVPTVVAIDEFSGIGASQIVRLFARGRSAGMSLVLATQELADLEAAGDRALRDQVLGNVGAVIAYRQNVPSSAALISEVAGTRPAWITTQSMSAPLLGQGTPGSSSRRRGEEPIIDPSRVKRLGTGEAVVIAPGSGRSPSLTRIHHPKEARR
jgi:type IV secretory pathway TraG/TraD family ATPase VirD4